MVSVLAGCEYGEMEWVTAPYDLGYKNTEVDPTLPPVWEQVVNSTETQCLIRIEEYEDPAIVDDIFSAEDVGGMVVELERRYAGNAYVEEAAKRNLAAFLLHLGSCELAGRILEELPSSDSKRYLARARYLQGRVKEAGTLSKKLLEENPRDTNSLNLLGRICIDRGECERALEYFRRTLGLDPYNRCAIDAVKRLEKELTDPAAGRRSRAGDGN